MGGVVEDEADALRRPRRHKRLQRVAGQVELFCRNGGLGNCNGAFGIAGLEAGKLPCPFQPVQHRIADAETHIGLGDFRMRIFCQIASSVLPALRVSPLRE